MYLVGSFYFITQSWLKEYLPLSFLTLFNIITQLDLAAGDKKETFVFLFNKHIWVKKKKGLIFIQMFSVFLKVKMSVFCWWFGVIYTLQISEKGVIFWKWRTYRVIPFLRVMGLEVNCFSKSHSQSCYWAEWQRKTTFLWFSCPQDYSLRVNVRQFRMGYNKCLFWLQISFSRFTSHTWKQCRKFGL